jgi:hypothetical protein
MEAKKYQSIGWGTTFAARETRSADAVGSQTEVPLFERLYAGGEKAYVGMAAADWDHSVMRMILSVGSASSKGRLSSGV